MKKNIALTSGDRDGIAPEISIKAWEYFANKNDFVFFLIGKNDYFNKLNFKNYSIINDPNEALDVFPKSIPLFLLDCDIKDEMIKSIDFANNFAVTKKCDAIVTNPINKEKINKSDFNEIGHTQYLAKLNNCSSIMMMYTEQFSTIAMTDHIPILNLHKYINFEYIYKKIKFTISSIEQISTKKLCYAICALNPHAGENGLIGNEEIDIIIPVIKKLKEEGIIIDGPLSADSCFSKYQKKKYDLFFCFYHDQALMPVKMVGNAVNVTLGLPYLRTSPGHGCAYDIAYKNIADPTSLINSFKFVIDYI